MVPTAGQSIVYLWLSSSKVVLYWRLFGVTALPLIHDFLPKLNFVRLFQYWDVPRYVRNFEQGLMMAWDNYIDGKVIDHIMVSEDGEERGTMEIELLAIEQKEKGWEKASFDQKRFALHDDFWS